MSFLDVAAASRFYVQRLTRRRRSETCSAAFETSDSKLQNWKRKGPFAGLQIPEGEPLHHPVGKFQRGSFELL